VIATSRSVGIRLRMKEYDMGKYDDIINLPHKQSTRRSHMSLYDRAAQFSPFAALTGHDAAIKETARLTDKKVELDEGSKERLNMRLQLILENLISTPEVTITYFMPDERKTGGAYVEAVGIVKKVDEYEQIVIMRDGRKIPIDDIINIEGALFRHLD